MCTSAPTPLSILTIPVPTLPLLAYLNTFDVMQVGFRVSCGYPLGDDGTACTTPDYSSALNHVWPFYNTSITPLPPSSALPPTLFPAGLNTVPDNFNLNTPQWAAANYPYSSAVENTVMFLVLCLVSQLAVLGARVDGWFFTRRPGYVLLTIVATQMIATTIVAGTIRAYPVRTVVRCPVCCCADTLSRLGKHAGCVM